MSAADRSRWAHWFVECADQADDLSEDEKRGLLVAAHHLLDNGVVGKVATIEVDADAGEVLADHVRGRLDADIAGRVL